MAAGKNLASKILEEKGFSSIDADSVVHQAVENSKEKILSSFSSLAQKKNINLLDSEGKINRRALGALIFTDKKLLEKQESIVYPEVTRILEEFIQTENQKNHKDVVINATVLYKVSLINKMDFILFVDSPLLQRAFRSKKRDNLPFKQIFSRFSKQKNLFSKYKKSNADIRRVWNIGSKSSLERKIDKILRVQRR